MRKRPFMQVDVFTDKPYAGNPVAVVLDAEGLDTEQMRTIARWTNLSETTFVLPPDRSEADYRLRIFTPNSELPFAGHPTLGSAHALIEASIARPRNGRLVQSCGAGLVRICVDAPADPLWLELPDARAVPLADADRRAIERALGITLAPDAAAIDVGPVWLVAKAESADAVLAANPDFTAIADVSRSLGAIGVTIYGPHRGAPERYEVRSLAPAAGVPEDPVCGSGNGSVAVHVALAGDRTPYVARQGRAIGRDGRVSVRYSGNKVEVGGHAIVCVRGEILA